MCNIVFLLIVISLTVTIINAYHISRDGKRHPVRKVLQVQRSDVTDSTTFLLPLSEIIKTMGWNYVIFIHDKVDVDLVRNILEFVENRHANLKMNIYELTGNRRESMRDILIQRYSQQSPVPMILMLRNSTTTFLKIANNLDLESNKTTNYRTNSYWILLSPSPIIIDYFELLLEHIIFMNVNDTVEFSTKNTRNNVQDIKCLVQQYDSDLQHSKCSTTNLYPQSSYKLNRRNLKIGTLESIWIKKRVDTGGIADYTGVVADLTTILANLLNFTYTYVQPNDKKYGGKKNGKWRGLMRLAERRDIDVIIADLTITMERSEVVDYIYPPFHMENLGVLYKKGSRQSNGSSWFKIFSPLHWHVYLLTIASILVVGTLLAVVDNEKTYLTKRHVVRNNACGVSYLIISLLGFVSVRGDGIWPKRDAARVIVAFFWIFCVVITSVYIGNLTAKLTDITENPPFESLEGLIARPDWTAGFTGDSLSQATVSNTTNQILHTLWQKILECNKTDPNVLESNKTIQVEKVLNSNNYAYIVSDPLYFVLSRNDCALNTAGVAIPGLSLAIAVTKNSYLKYDFDSVMWKLSDNGFLKRLTDQHYKDNRPLSCKLKESNRSMRLGDMLGCILVVSVGMAMAFIVLAVERMVKRQHILRGRC
ncbi:hypothetical protein SNE40_007820 [Patella caerulea]|uniref:Ionotropic glutamate receptor C-terminal domain-containing protein n=1 Tax=Patella caerulea TaxID=87958 RepID=A0AAN8K4D0_PATCE